MIKGDIVLVRFPFTNRSESKLRPAVILFSNTLDFTACFITSKIEWEEPTDVHLIPNHRNGLLKDSLIRTNKIATLERTLAKGLLGKLNIDELNDLDNKLKLLLQLT